MHWPVKAWSIGEGRSPAIRASTVLAAWAPSGIAAWQLIRSGSPDGAAASPAATMRSSSTLVSVSSVSSLPTASVRSPDRAARSGTPNPAVQIVTKLGSRLPSCRVTASAATAVTVAPGPSTISTPSLRNRRATERRPPVDEGTARAPIRTPG